MGFLRRAGSGDVPVFPRRRGLRFGYSDASNIEDYDPARERSALGVGDVVDGVYAMGPGDEEDPWTWG
jgi:hypothetical protein